MTRDTETRQAPGVAGARADRGREARLKAALKANMARRKAQAKARAEPGPGLDDPDPETGGQEETSGSAADRHKDTE